jgi:hypothetical protein
MDILGTMKRLHDRLKSAFQYIIVVIIALFLFSCTGPVDPGMKYHRTDSVSPLKKDNRKKPPSSFQDTVTIRTRSAVFYHPDSLQLIKIKTVNEKMIFESLMHDCFYQMRNARLVIQRDWPTIQIIDISKIRWLNFIRPDGKKKIIDLDAVNDICGIYLFDPARDPERIDMMNIDTELEYYFKK